MSINHTHTSPESQPYTNYQHPDAFNPYCGLYHLIQAAEPKSLGYD